MSDLFKLCCWVRGQPPENVIQMDISPTATVGTLRRLLKEAGELYGPPSTLRLYKLRDFVPTPFKKNLNGVILSEHGKLLDATDELSQVFLAPPPKRYLHIIVGTWRRRSKLALTIDSCLFRFTIPDNLLLVSRCRYLPRIFS